MGQHTHFTPPIFWACILQTEERWGWSNHNWSCLISLTSVISTSTAGMLTLTATPLLSLYIGLFTFYSSRKFKLMFKWTHRIPYSSTLEESHLSDAGPVMDNSLCGASSLSLFWVCSSRVVVVHLACLACTTIQRWVPSVRAMRKSQFWWRTHEHLVHWLFTRWKGMPSTIWCSTLYSSFSHQSFTFLPL